MFNNLKVYFIGSNETLAYNDKVAGLFGDYSITDNNAIHRLEDRKLTDDETDQFLEELEKIETTEIDKNKNPEEITNVLDKILKIHPEVKYKIHGNWFVNAEPKIDPDTKTKLAREPDVDLAKKAKPKAKPKVEKKDSAQKAQEQWDKDRKKWQSKPERELAEKGKVKESKYSGFKGVLFDMIKGLADPAKKPEKEELQKRLRRDWATYKKNEKILNENKELIDALQDKFANNEITPEGISLMNELIARDPAIVKEIDLEKDVPNKLRLPLNKFKNKLKEVDLKVDNKTLVDNITNMFEKEKLKVEDITITEKNGEKEVDVALADWDSFFKLANVLGLRLNDIKK